MQKHPENKIKDNSMDHHKQPHQNQQQQQQQHQQQQQQQQQQRSPIKPITIRTSHLPPAPHRDRHHRSSHKKKNK